MSHVERVASASRVRASLSDMDVRVVTGGDGEPSPELALRTAARAWNSIAPGATHHLVLQDDVLPCANFAAMLTTAVRARPSACFSLFAEWASLSGQSARLAAIAGCPWAPVVDEFMPAPAVLLPAEVARGFADHLEAALGGPERRDAFLLASYLEQRGETPYVLVPNLVEHDVPVVPSLLPNGKVRGPRRSACYAGQLPAPETTLVGTPDELAYPALLPYHSRDDLVSFMLSRAGGRGRWERDPVFRWARGRGWDLRTLHALADEVRPRRTPAIGADLRREFWLSGFAAGFVLRAHLPDDDDLSQRLRTDMPRLALRTMATGPLRRLLAEPVLLSEGANILPIVEHGLLQGYANA
ncbi:hypothetical protein [Symbioplanes lichenis]|uniref:hypothetical protein n=1 Tax=Symbioplanes lichenis TaxID=1629072 RepID=UPI00273942D2|nr:hypothetical protein [Actinoplanes lichenis]